MHRYSTSVLWDTNIIIVKNLVLSVRFSPMGRFIARLIRDKERTLNRIPVSMKVIPGIIRSMYHMMYMAWRN